MAARLIAVHFHFALFHVHAELHKRLGKEQSLCLHEIGILVFGQEDVRHFVGVVLVDGVDEIIHQGVGIARRLGIDDL